MEYFDELTVLSSTVTSLTKNKTKKFKKYESVLHQTQNLFPFSLTPAEKNMPQSKLSEMYMV